MERRISVKKYVIALFLTLVIFAGGIVFGAMLENARLNDSTQINLQEKVNLLSLQLQQKYIDSGIADCAALNQILESNINELEKKGRVIIDYEQKSVLNGEEFDLQLRDYFLTEIQFLLISQDIDKKCPQNSIKVIYFYDENQFDTQGRILDYLKKLFGPKVLIFSFDSGFLEEPMITILLTSYNISHYPAVVVEEKVFQGHTPVKTLMEQICSGFERLEGEIPQECGIFKPE
ncbi:MAG: hypothetical protein Q8R37_06035 [Nanoarchaeota archaeon]|nr:hypothetical protein [Nanoarchaeota archaeon]